MVLAPLAGVAAVAGGVVNANKGLNSVACTRDALLLLLLSRLFLDARDSVLLRVLCPVLVRGCRLRTAAAVLLRFFLQQWFSLPR